MHDELMTQNTQKSLFERRFLAKNLPPKIAYHCRQSTIITAP